MNQRLTVRMRIWLDFFIVFTYFVGQIERVIVLVRKQRAYDDSCDLSKK